MIPGWAVQELAQRLNGSMVQGKLVKEYAERYGVSVKTVYRRLAAAGGRKASLRITAEERAAAFLVSGYLQACMSKKGVAPSTEVAIKELVRMGKIGQCPGQSLVLGPWSRRPLSDSASGGTQTNTDEHGLTQAKTGTVPRSADVGLGAVQSPFSRQRCDQVMKEMGLTKRHMHAPKACRRLMAAAPNDWHQVDWSPAGMFYLENGWIGVTPNYKKDTNLKKGRTPIRIGMVVDMYSGCCYAKAYEAAGESTELAVSTLYDAWRDKGDPGFPMHGVPWHLYSDQSGALKSGPAQALLDNLFCKWVGHMARRPTATGLAERRIQSCQKWETVIRGRQAFGYQFSLREFNSWLHEWCVDENNRAWRGTGQSRVQSSDSRIQSCEEAAGAEIGDSPTERLRRTQRGTVPISAKVTRFQAWSQAISDENIRRCPEWEDFVRLSAAMEDTRKVSQYQTIQWNGETMFLGDGAVEVIGEKVHVYRMADGRQYAKYGGKVFGPLAEGAPVNIMGIDYKQPRLTESERNLRQAREDAAGIGMRAADMAHIRDEKSETYPLREGRRIEKADSLQLTANSRTGRGARNYLEAKDWLVNRVGSLAGLDWEAMAGLERTIDGLLLESGEITEKELEMIAEAIESERESGDTRILVGSENRGQSLEAAQGPAEGQSPFSQGKERACSE